MIIKPLITVPFDPSKREERLRSLLESPPIQSPDDSGVGFSLEKVAQGYRLHNVLHRGVLYEFDWSGVLLPGDGTATPKSHTQEEWLSHPEYRTLGGVVFDIPSGPEYAATIVALYHHRDTKNATQMKLLAEFTSVLAKGFAEYWVMTSTRTTYTKKGDDAVEHCRWRGDRYSVDAAVAGSNDALTVGVAVEANAWLGVADIPEFLAAVQWLTGKDISYVWRCTKEKNDFERALVLGVSGRFDIDANSSIGSGRPARGVAVRKKYST